jgi:Ca-activated chloride channel family protein
MGNYKDTMMEQLADKGDGNYSYVDSEAEARKLFSEQVSGMLEVVAGREDPGRDRPQRGEDATA